MEHEVLENKQNSYYVMWFWTYSLASLLCRSSVIQFSESLKERVTFSFLDGMHLP